MYCYDKDVSTVIPRYVLVVVDSSDPKVLKKKTCAAFITPLGKERESMFSSEIGRQNLAK